VADSLVVGIAASAKFARLVVAIEAELGRKLSAWDGEASVAVLAPNKTFACGRKLPVGLRVIWVEQSPESDVAGGMVCVLRSGDEEVSKYPFDAMSSHAFPGGNPAFDSTAARTVVDLLRRADHAPWVVPEKSGCNRPLPLWRKFMEKRVWSLAGMSPQGRIDWLHSTLDSTLADPFPISHRGREWLFFEEQSFGANGILSAAVLDNGRLVEMAHNILPSSTHRSWPYVFDHGGEIWMIPESGADREVALWRCTRFPDAWEKVRVLLSGVAWTDPVLFEKGGAWWLFVSRSGPSRESHSDSLHLFHSRDPWNEAFVPHPWNPVSIGVVGSRPAGRILSESNALVRPAQDCSERYGKALVFRKILELTPERYSEITIRRCEAPMGAWGIHTWNLTESGIVVDLLEGRSRFAEPTSRAAPADGPRDRSHRASTLPDKYRR
jgi:hypothetical protein